MAVADVTEPSVLVQRRRAFDWLALVAVVVAAWAAVGALGEHTHTGSVVAITGAWIAMVAAMMLPTLVPMLRTLSAMLAGRARMAWWSFVAGYLAVWASAGVVGVALQRLARPAIASSPQIVVPAVLALAGAYQFTRWKSACLDACTSPFRWFLRHWRDGSAGGGAMGVRHGVTCLGCCWALMLLAVIATGLGVIGMAAMTAVMIIEKIPALGARLRVPIGVALIAAAVAMVAADHPTHTDHHHLIGAHHGTLVTDR
jgi:predicted metal-binding membrane protein